MYNKSSDIQIFIARSLLTMAKCLYKLGYAFFWRFSPPHSKIYKLIRSSVRRKIAVKPDLPKNTHLKKQFSFLERMAITAERMTNSEKKHAKTMLSEAQFQIVIDVRGQNEKSIIETLQSLKNQVYTRWTAFVLVDSSNLKELEFQDLRVKSCHANELLDLVKEQPYPNNSYICFVKAGDLFFSETLLMLSKFLSVDIISFDLLRIDQWGNESYWCRPTKISPELMQSENALSHALINLPKVLELLEGIDPKFFDKKEIEWLLIKKLTDDSRIRHIHLPIFLLVETILEERTFTNKVIDNQPDQHSAYIGKDDLVSIIIPTKDKLELLKKCINSLLAITDYPSIEIILVDSGSTEPETLQYYKELINLKFIKLFHLNDGFNYSRAINLGVKESRGNFLLTLNNDIEILYSNWLSELIRLVKQPSVGVVSPKMLYPDGTIQHAGIVFDSTRLFSHVFSHQLNGISGPHGSTDWYRNYLAITGACQAFRREVYDALGGYNEDYKLTFSDIEFCIKAYLNGFRNIYSPNSVIIHNESATRGDENPSDDIYRAYKNMYDILMSGDPYFSPKLTNPYEPRLRTIEPSREELIRLRLNNSSQDGENSRKFSG